MLIGSSSSCIRWPGTFKYLCSYLVFSKYGLLGELPEVVNHTRNLTATSSVLGFLSLDT